MKRLNDVSGMPVALLAKLEHSKAHKLFRIANDHRMTARVLESAAWEDVSAVVNWFRENGKFDEAIDWLYQNTPDIPLRTITINVLINCIENKQP